MKNQDKASIEQLQLFDEDQDMNEVVSADDERETSSSNAAEETQGTAQADPASGIKPLEEFAKKQQEEKVKSKSGKENRKDTNLLIEILDVIRSVAVCFFISWLIATYVAKPIRIDGTSMYPTLYHNDFGFSNIIGLKFGDLKRFDVVVVYEPWLDDYVIKRIIGLPNETISYKDNRLYINGEYVEEPFFDEEYRTSMMMNSNSYFTNDFDAVTLGDDEYFIMGDNRPKSSDSREYGPIKKNQIVSKGTLILYPINHIGLH